jgi:ATP-binding cassette subfamily B protein
MIATRAGRGARPPRAGDEPPKSWRERARSVREAYGNIPGAFRLVWGADKPATIVMGALTLVSALLPAAQAWAAALIVDTVVNQLGRGATPVAGLEAALPYLGLEFGLLLASTIISQIRRLYEHVLNARLGHHINTAIIRKALTLDLQYFEDAAFYDKLQNARREADYRALGIINGAFMVVQNLITLLSFAALLLAFSPLITVVLFGATIPAFIAQSKYSHMYFRLLTWRAPEFRRMQYLEHVLTVDNTVKEIKLFGLGEPLLQRYSDTFWKFFHEDTALARRRSLISLGWGLLATVSYYGAYAYIIFQAIAGVITLGGMTLYLTLFRQSQGTFQGLFDNIARLYENGLFMDNLFGFLRLTPQMARADRPAPEPGTLTRGLEFRGVSFRYPGREAWALQPHHRARREDRARRPERRRQDHPDQAAHPALRPDRGRHPAGRGGPTRL